MRSSFRKNYQREIRLIIAILFYALLLPAENTPAAEIDCCSCHGYRTMASFDRGVSKTLYVDIDTFKTSSHGKAACIECHEDSKEIPHKKEHKKVDCTMECHISENGEEKLYSHKEAAEAVFASIHSRFDKNGNIKKNSNLLPDCAGCHPFDHTSKRLSINKQLHTLMSKELVIKICGGCHIRPAIISKFRLSDVLASYNESFHGKQRLFGNGDMPDCIDCHADPEKGAHHIRGKEAGKETAHCKTGGCHKSAGEELKGFHVHVSYDSKDYPVEYYMRLIFRILAALVVFSLIGIVFLELVRRLFPNFSLSRKKEGR